MKPKRKRVQTKDPFANGTLAARTPFKWKISLLVGSSVLTMLAGEAGTRLACAWSHRPPIIVSDSRTGWSVKPNLPQAIKASR